MSQTTILSYQGEGRFQEQNLKAATEKGDQALALGRCLLLSAVAIAKRRKVDLMGMKVEVVKREGSYSALVRIPEEASISEPDRVRIVNALKACGVRKKLGASVNLALGIEILSVA